MIKKTAYMENKENMANHEHEETMDILELLTRNSEDTSQVNGIVIGTLSGFGESGESGVPFVEFPLNPSRHPLPSRSTVELNEHHIGREVALMFEMNDVRKPIIIGLMHVPGNHAAVEVKNEEEILKISAETEIHICCGESFIRMNKNGKIEIRGNDILSQAARNNRIRGGSIGLN